MILEKKNRTFNEKKRPIQYMHCSWKAIPHARTNFPERCSFIHWVLGKMKNLSASLTPHSNVKRYLAIISAIDTLLPKQNKKPNAC